MEKFSAEMNTDTCVFNYSSFEDRTISQDSKTSICEEEGKAWPCILTEKQLSLKYPDKKCGH